MSNLEKINNVLNPDFITNTNKLSEKEVAMEIEILKDGCNSIIFQLDKKLEGYKGGIFPFFNNLNKNVCSVNDYIIFAEKNAQVFALVIELKKGKSSTTGQLKAGACFVDFVQSTVNRVNNFNLVIHKRFISIKEFKRKKNTKESEIAYDGSHHHDFRQNKMRLRFFLK